MGLPFARAASCVTMGAGASRYKSVEDAVGCGIPHTDIDNYLAQDCEAELASINRCFGQDVHLPSSATACGRAAQKTIEQLGFDPSKVLYCNSTGRDELAREHQWWRYLEGVSQESDHETRNLIFNMGGLGGVLAAGKTGLQACSTHAIESGGCIFMFCASHVGVDADGTVGKMLHENMKKPSPCCNSSDLALKWARKAAGGKNAVSDDPDDYQMDQLKTIVADSLTRIDLAAQEDKGSAAEMAEVVYEAIHRKIVQLVPDHLAHSVPVVLCGGIQIHTNPGKPDFFAPRHFEIYSPGSNPPNDAMAAYRANLKTLILFQTELTAAADRLAAVENGAK